MVTESVGSLGGYPAGTVRYSSDLELPIVTASGACEGPMLSTTIETGGKRTLVVATPGSSGASGYIGESCGRAFEKSHAGTGERHQRLALRVRPDRRSDRGNQTRRV